MPRVDIKAIIKDLNGINYQTIDCGINYIKLNDRLIYKGDIENENNR